MFCPNFRFVFMVNPEKRLIVVRPIGDMPGVDFVDRLFEAYGNVEAPWTFNRLIDLRRFDGHLTDKDHTRINARWRELSAGRDYHAYVAIVSFDAMDWLRVPMVRPGLSNETVCHFSDYHEAVGWLTAPNRTGYLASLAPPARVRRDDGRIRVE